MRCTLVLLLSLLVAPPQFADAQSILSESGRKIGSLGGYSLRSCYRLSVSGICYAGGLGYLAGCTSQCSIAIQDILALPRLATAGKILLKGRLFDQEAQRPISSGLVTVYGPGGVTFGAATQADGDFEIEIGSQGNLLEEVDLGDLDVPSSEMEFSPYTIFLVPD